ncbi:unnamed protein product [Thelazia callipaeda]|uniref:Transaldolase n=1 Tax=Thelazia callipaeda TaxID=103827 RepID=A0A0N5CKB3_THECL|nr:unnamed protein product [Thelazia callipaeda]
MTSVLDQMRTTTKVVADCVDFAAIKLFGAVDATTNPSILLAASKLSEYKPFLDEGIAYARKHQSLNCREMRALAMDKIAVLLGKEVLSVVPGRVSTEVDARLAFDKDAQVTKALALIKLYEEEGIAKERILIKIPASWEGIQAARVLENKHGVHCNMTLLFNFYQAVACAEANATLISPFVGRIRDWYLKNGDSKDFSRDTDPGVQNVRKIYTYYKKYDYQTEVMAASFRNTDEIKGLIGCDLMTISAALLKDISEDKESVPVVLSPEKAKQSNLQKISLTEAMFRFEMNEDKMAADLLADGIRRFVADARAMEALIEKVL